MHQTFKLYDNKRDTSLDHTHKELEFIIVDEGFLNITYAGRAYTINKGTIFMIAPNLTHALDESLSQTKYRILHINLANTMFSLNHPLSDYYDGILYNRAFLANPISDPFLIDKINTLYHHIQHPSMEYATLRGFTYLFELISCLYTTHHIILTENKRTKAWTKMESAILYIEYHLQDDITLEEISYFANYSPNHFSKLFKSYTGYTFNPYVLHMRLEKSKHLLLGKHNVSDVAQMIGFNSPAYYTKQFKKKYGMTPKEFVKENHAYT